MSEKRFHDPDHTLSNLIRRALGRHPHFARGGLTIELQEDGVVLKGVVRSYYHKQLAQESIRRVEGVRRVHNELEVVG